MADPFRVAIIFFQIDIKLKNLKKLIVRLNEIVSVAFRFVTFDKFYCSQFSVLAYMSPNLIKLQKGCEWQDSR